MTEYIDITATEDRIYNRWGMHPRYFADNNTKEGQEADRDATILELMASDFVIKITEEEIRRKLDDSNS